jgi:hypothetical protein
MDIIMRMWMVDPKIMCNQHLLGEHVEIHMLVGCLNKNMSIDGYIYGGLVEIHNIKSRHDAIVQEMKARKMVHKTPIESNEKIWKVAGHVDVRKSELDLMERCLECRKQKDRVLLAKVGSMFI